MIQAIVFLPLIGAILAGLIAIVGAHARNPSGDAVEHHDDGHGHGAQSHKHASNAHDEHGHDDHGHDDHHAAEPPAAGSRAAEFITTGLLLFGVCELARFKPEERTWQLALERAQLLALANLGLSPFVYFWSRQPGEAYYLQIILVLAFTGLLFLCQLNHVLQRLVAMLPDETLRADTRFFTRLNLTLMILALVLIAEMSHD